MEDLQLAREYSRRSSARYFGLTTLLAVRLLKALFAHSAPMRFCERLDAMLFRGPVHPALLAVRAPPRDDQVISQGEAPRLALATGEAGRSRFPEGWSDDAGRSLWWSRR